MAVCSRAGLGIKRFIKKIHGVYIGGGGGMRLINQKAVCNRIGSRVLKF